MSDKKPRKRITNVTFSQCGDGERFYAQITYVLDCGNILESIRNKYTETKYIYGCDKLEKLEKRCMKSRRSIEEQLAERIRGAGANRFNAMVSAQKLCREM